MTVVCLQQGIAVLGMCGSSTVTVIWDTGLQGWQRCTKNCWGEQQRWQWWLEAYLHKNHVDAGRPVTG